VRRGAEEGGEGEQRPGQKLAQRHQIAIRLRSKPAAPLDELAAEVFQMRDRPAKSCESQTQKGEKDGPGGLGTTRCGGRGHRRDDPGDRGVRLLRRIL